jgi:hypothetical protein
VFCSDNYKLGHYDGLYGFIAFLSIGANDMCEGDKEDLALRIEEWEESKLKLESINLEYFEMH